MRDCEPFVLLAMSETSSLIELLVLSVLSTHEKNGTWKITTTEDGRPVMSNLQNQETLRRAFPRVRGLYHPNEISAEMIISMLIFDNYVDHATLEPRIIKAWKNIFEPVRQALAR